jgi:hypothetical protein
MKWAGWGEIDMRAAQRETTLLWGQGWGSDAVCTHGE